MDAFSIEGQKILRGETEAAGSKNASLPILAACLLTEEECVIENVPDLRDVRTMQRLLGILGRAAERDGRNIIVRAGSATSVEAPYDLVSTMRASISVLGPLLAKEGEAKVSFPGGCAIGDRPIDLHLKGLEALGAEIEITHGYVHARSRGLAGANIYLAGPNGSSVLATDNVMMAAALAEGVTVIQAAALEPEVVDACNFLVAMGARIEGVGTSTLTITGVSRLHGCRYRIIPDRIESGTLLAAAACTGGEIFVRGARADHLGIVLESFQKAGMQVQSDAEGIRLASRLPAKPLDIETLPYPGFPTDMQAPMMALLACADGTSIVTEHIYPERYIHVAEFNRMGADIKLDEHIARVRGVKKLEGAPVMASDLRAGAALVIAALAAEGTSLVRRIYHIDRGYARLEEKLESLGARIMRVTE
ncbi:MAG: UDP-N-acetylglucosamine 1-carboxyvinyltransferase [Spirochaetota bacterium]|jgi:UDP-N-acetylglucosamine 1-carboxyvinyltransferase|nr:UDP-N-acetylglucosamine 1-carboxyvinyltransferase [Spirochaetota bacterium]